MGAFLEHFTETVTINRMTGTDSWGDTAYASDATLTARVERDRREVLNDLGQTITSNALIFTEDEVGAGDKVTVTIDGADREYVVEASLKHFDLDGVFSHYEVIV